MSTAQRTREAPGPDELFVYQKASLADVLARIDRIQLELSEFSRGEDPAEAAAAEQVETTSSHDLVFGIRSPGFRVPVEIMSQMTRFLSAEAEYKVRLMTTMRQAAVDFGWDNKATMLAMHFLKLKLNL